VLLKQAYALADRTLSDAWLMRGVREGAKLRGGCESLERMHWRRTLTEAAHRNFAPR
jgi:hypothetical protein